MKKYRTVLTALLLVLTLGGQTYQFAQDPSTRLAHDTQEYNNHGFLLDLATTAHEFIKSDPMQCWLDTKDVVHRHAPTGSIDDETSHSIRVDRYHVPTQGTVAILVRASADTDKKKGEGCRLYVWVIRGDFMMEMMSEREDSGVAWQGRLDVRVVHQIADEVMVKQKERGKRMKKP